MLVISAVGAAEAMLVRPSYFMKRVRHAGSRRTIRCGTMTKVTSATSHQAPVANTAAERARDARWDLLAAGFVLIGGLAMVLIHYFGGTEGDPEGWFAAVGFAAPILGAGALAAVGSLVDAPWLWWAAGFALVPCAIVSFVMFPLLAPAIALIVLGLRNRDGDMRERWGVVFVVALIASFGFVVFHEDPATWAGGSNSNIVTTTEATISVVVAVCVVVVGWAIAAAPPRRTQRRPD